MLKRLLMASVLRRLLRGSGRPPTGYAPRPGQRSGFGLWGPLPSYSRTTRRGNRVRVSGCCLPIPLALSAGVLGSAAMGLRRLRNGAR